MTANLDKNATSAISDAELAGLFGWLDDYYPLTLAVSGGVDSMALLLLLARWLELDGTGIGAPKHLLDGPDEPDGPDGHQISLPPRNRQIAVVTVNHGLRAEAAAEADFVKREAQALGFHHQTLVWQGAKPSSGVQAAARAARYNLIAAFHRQHWRAEGVPVPGAMVTAHHLDDAAETLLMRLARGSGVDGLAGMAVKSTREALHLLRPLLAISKCRLQATVSKADVPFVEDPSNENSDYERVRLRAARAGLQAAGLCNDKLALSARRLSEVREALDYATDEFSRACLLNHHDGAYASLDLASFQAAPRAMRVRLLQRLIALHGGQAAPARLSKIEALADRLCEAVPPTLTLGGCWITSRNDEGDKLIIVREMDRSGQCLEEFELQPGQQAIWDRRFDVRLSHCEGQAVTIKALAPRKFLELKENIRTSMPLRPWAVSRLPSFWRGSELVAVPHLAAFDAALMPEDCQQNPLVEVHFIEDWQGRQGSKRA